METEQSGLSILMFPWLGHGHASPYLELAKNLLNKNFKIYYCSTPINLVSVSRVLGKSSDSIHLVELHLPSSPELPPCSHTTKNIPPSLIPQLFNAFNNSKSSFFDIISFLKPDMVIYDCFQPWAATISSSLGIPAVHFGVSAAACHALLYHQVTKKDQAFPYDALFLQGYEQNHFESTLVYKLMKEDVEHHGYAHYNLSQDIILIKTSRSLEGKYIDYLSTMLQKKIVPVGPLIARTSCNEKDATGVVEWLSRKRKFSTVFISVGSENYLSMNQMHEVANGLEMCNNVNFIWVVRSPNEEKVDANEAFPRGFLDRVRERGMIVEGWAPQDAILAHQSIGAFMSHCGWNSALESIHFGVPVIGIPFKLDQPLNARLMVEAGVAVEVVRDKKNGDFSSQEVANAIKKVVEEKTGEEMRRKAAEMSEKMKKEDKYVMSDAAEELLKICMEHRRRRISSEL